MNPDNLLTLKDDMIAFIEGHGMRHFPALIPDDTPRVWWNDPAPGDKGDPRDQRAESWKDFVEMAKATGAPMVCIGEDMLDKATLEVLASELAEMSALEGPTGEEMEMLDRLGRHVGKLGHIELAFAHQGVLFVHETATEWYRQYREMVDALDDFGEIVEEPFRDNEERD